MQYIEKDPTTSVVVVNGLLKSWPWTVSAKQVVFLNELEEVLELMGPELLDTIIEPLFKAIAKCVGSFHFQVCCIVVPIPLSCSVRHILCRLPCRLRSARCSYGTMTTCSMYAFIASDAVVLLGFCIDVTSCICVQHGCLSKAYGARVLPLVFTPIHKLAQRTFPENLA